MPKKLIAEKPISIAEVKKLLEKKGEKELDQFQHITLDYAKKFEKVEGKKVEELINKLVEKFGIVREEAVQIVNSMPKSVEELRPFFITAKRRIIGTDLLEEMLKIMDEFRK
jgi:DNA-directed RNA polymerase subunit F